MLSFIIHIYFTCLQLHMLPSVQSTWDPDIQRELSLYRFKAVLKRKVIRPNSEEPSKGELFLIQVIVDCCLLQRLLKNDVTTPIVLPV